jgi:hypothetical protein
MYEQEAKLREYAESAKCAAGTATPGSIGNSLRQDTAEPRRETMRERLSGRIDRSRREQYRTDQMSELLFLLEKNPELARILELIEQVSI